MTDFVVGPGVAAAIEAAGDEARSNEIYIINEPAGQRVSQTIGRDALWYWLEADNKVQRLPFE